MALQRVRPEEIEKRSMEIIRGELEGLGPLPPADRLPVVERVIHATADFDFRDSLFFSPGAVAAGTADRERRHRSIPGRDRARDSGGRATHRASRKRPR